MVAAETNGTASNEPILFYFIQMSIDRLEHTLCSPKRDLNAYRHGCYTNADSRYVTLMICKDALTNHIIFPTGAQKLIEEIAQVCTYLRHCP